MIRKKTAAWPVRCISILLLCILLAGCTRPGGSGKTEQETGMSETAKTGQEAGTAETAETEQETGMAETAKTAEEAAASASAKSAAESAPETAAGDAATGTSAAAAGTMTGAVQTAEPAKPAEPAKSGEPAKPAGSAGIAEPAEPQPEALTQEQKTDKMIREYLETLPLEDKVSGLFILTPEQLTEYDVVTEADDLVQESLEEYPVAGMVFFGQNIVDRDQVKDLLASIKEWGSIYPVKNKEARTAAEKTGAAEAASTAAESAAAEEKSEPGMVLPPFLAIDEEGGNVLRIGSSAIDVPYVGSMGSVGAGGDPEAAYEAGNTIGAYLQKLGFNLDFAPDADVLVDPSNVTIGDRSFGSDPELCGQMVHRYVDGLHKNGIASCIKHFPGLGDTESDTHTGAAWSSRSIEDYRGAEFLSFGGGIEAGTEMVMISHLSNSALSGSDIPASLNKTIITDILRSELGFEGIVITDSLRMGAIAERFDSAEAAAAAFEAGADVLLMPSDFHAARHGILDAVHDGRISEERIDESLFRILRLRAALDESREEHAEEAE